MSAQRAVVVVDDDVDHALIARLVIRQIDPDASVEVMTDPRQVAARLMDAPRGALVLIDRNLDGRNGIDLLPLLSMERPDLQTVILSAALLESDRGRALALGACEALEKPSSVAAWRSLLQSVLTDAGGRPRRTRAA